MWLSEAAGTSPPSDIWTVIASTLGGLVLMVGAYFTRRRGGKTPDEAEEVEPEETVRKVARATATKAVDEYKALIEEQLRKTEEDEAALRRQLRDMQAELDRAREDAATWHRRHDVLQARTERRGD